MLIKKSSKFNANFAQLVTVLKLRCIYQFLILNFYFYRQKVGCESNSFQHIELRLGLSQKFPESFD